MQSNLEQNKTKLLLFQNELKEKKDFLDITYTQHFSNLNNLFSKILKTIYDTQNELCLKFDANIQVMKAKIKSQMTFVWDSQKEIDKILGDISNNYQNIITEMKVDSFKGVCGLYEEKITTMGDKVASLANEHYEYLLFEENTNQIQNFKLLDLQKLYNVFKKTSFLSPKIQEIIKNVKINIDRNDGSTECSNMRTLMTKNNSIHEESNRNSLFSNPSSILFATKENSNCKSNQTSKKELLTDEKTQKKMKNNSSIHIRMFLNTSSHEKISGVENNKVFQTERDRKKKRTKSKIPHNFMPHAISIDILNDKN